jgi:hypothetical protein
MPVPSSAVQANFNMTPVKDGVSSGPYGGQPVQVSDEAYRTYNKLVDPEGIFGNKLSRMLFSSVLVKSDEPDGLSPFEGYALKKIGPANSKTAMNWEGYNEVASGYILLASEVISTTEFDTKELDLKTICVEGISSIVDRIVCNRREWEVRDPLLIMEVGLSMWFNLYSLCRRSTGGGKMLMFITGLFKFISHNRNDEEERARGFWKRGGSGG